MVLTKVLRCSCRGHQWLELSNIDDLIGPVTYQPFSKWQVDAADAIMLCAKKNGCGKTVRLHDDRDWETIAFIANVWKTIWPEDYDRFVKEQGLAKQNLKNDRAIVKEKGDVRMQHVLEMPKILQMLILSCFEDQPWDKKFMTELARRMPLFMGGKKL